MRLPLVRTLNWPWGFPIHESSGFYNVNEAIQLAQIRLPVIGPNRLWDTAYNTYTNLNVVVNRNSYA